MNNIITSMPQFTFGQNIITLTDSYKISHHLLYAPGTTNVYSYIEARAGGEYKDVVFFGLQYILLRHLCGVVVTAEKIDRAERLFVSHFGMNTPFDRSKWEHILTVHGGRLPLRIMAVPEGTVLPESNALFTIEATDPECAWLVNYVETLLVHVWYTSTVATISREMKKVIWQAMERSGTATLENLLFRLHDFGFRGVSCVEQAALGGAAHLINFRGTDTLVACEMLMEVYGSDMPGFSIPAGEHSTYTSWGREGETEAYRNMLKQFPTGTIAAVSDSWNIYEAVGKIWGEELRDEVLARKGVLVIRPDSGDPKVVLTKILDIACEKFGYTVNEKGYKVLHEKVRIIQGDGISRRTVGQILDAIMDAGYSADNLSFGSGGGLLMDCNRDTQRFAMKCSEISLGEVRRDVYKAPATDSTKNSKRGRFAVVKRDGVIVTIPESEAHEGENMLQLVFENGTVCRVETLEAIRARAEFI